MACVASFFNVLDEANRIDIRYDMRSTRIRRTTHYSTISSQELYEECEEFEFNVEVTSHMGDEYEEVSFHVYYGCFDM